MIKGKKHVMFKDVKVGEKFICNNSYCIRIKDFQVTVKDYYKSAINANAIILPDQKLTYFSDNYEVIIDC